MKLSVKFILLTAMTLMLNLASGSESIGKHTVTVVQHQTAIQNVQAHAKHKRLLRSKIQRAIPFGAEDDTDDIIQSEDLATGYRRRDLSKIEHEDGISERVRWKLFLARQLALLKYREING